MNIATSLAELGTGLVAAVRSLPVYVKDLLTDASEAVAPKPRFEIADDLTGPGFVVLDRDLGREYPFGPRSNPDAALSAVQGGTVRFGFVPLGAHSGVTR